MTLVSRTETPYISLVSSPPVVCSVTAAQDTGTRWGPRKACVKGMSGPRVRLFTEGSRPSVCGVQVRTRGHCSPGKADTLHSVLGWCAGQWSSRAPRCLPHPHPHRKLCSAVCLPWGPSSDPSWSVTHTITMIVRANCGHLLRQTLCQVLRGGCQSHPQPWWEHRYRA